MSGTSMATSHVSGAIALLLAKHPGLAQRDQDAGQARNRSAARTQVHHREEQSARWRD